MATKCYTGQVCDVNARDTCSALCCMVCKISLDWACAERKARQGAETKRTAAFDAQELLVARYQRVLENWSRVVFQKSNHLALRIKEAATSVRSKLTAGATAIQALGRGFLGRKRVQKLRRLASERTMYLAIKMQSMYRGWKSRLRSSVMKTLQTTSKAAQKLFQVCDVDACFCVPPTSNQELAFACVHAMTETLITYARLSSACLLACALLYVVPWMEEPIWMHSDRSSGPLMNFSNRQAQKAFAIFDQDGDGLISPMVRFLFSSKKLHDCD